MPSVPRFYRRMLSDVEGSRFWCYASSMPSMLHAISSTSNPPLDRPGVYMIRNKSNGECYIGCSKNVRRRISDHFHGRGSRQLLECINTFGPASFEAIPLCYSIDGSIDHLYVVERDMILWFGSVWSGYNIAEAAPGLGGYGAAYGEVIKTALSRPDVAAHRSEMNLDPELRTRRGAAIKAALLTKRGTPPSEQKLASLSALHSNQEIQARRIAATRKANQNPDRRAKISAHASSCVWITNGTDSKRVIKSLPIPDGWVRGRPKGKPRPPTTD